MKALRAILTPRSNHTFGLDSKDSLGTSLFDVASDLTRKPLAPLEGVHDHKNLLEEMELDVLKDASGQAFPYQFAKGYPLGLTFAQKSYKSSESYITGAPLRNETSVELSKRGSVVWKEKAGLLHLGGQIFTFVPLASWSGATIGPIFGFAAESLLRYRTLYPSIGDSQEAPPVPLTASIAATMPRGSEFEFIGRVGGAASAGISITAGYAVGPAMVGAAFYTNTGLGGAFELGICVTALDEKGHIRVTVRRLSKVDTNFSIGVTAGLMYQIASNWTSVISPYARLLPQSSTTSSYLGSFTGVTTLNASASAGESEGFTTILCVDLDATTHEGQALYKEILLLRFERALEHARQNASITQVAVAQEKSSSHIQDGSLGVMGQPLLQNYENNRHVTGHIDLPSDKITYVDSTVNKRQTFWLWGTRDVKWQEVNVQNDSGKGKTPYFRFSYSDLDRRFSLKRLHSFIRFASLLGIKEETIIAGGEQRLAALKERLKKAAKVEIKYDLFFSTKAIEKILKSTPGQMKRAYFEASRMSKCDYADSPLTKDDAKSKEACAVLTLFDERAAKHRFDIFGFTREMHECYVRYTKLTGRSLSMDYGLLKQADNFAKLVDMAKCKECLSDSAQMLFVELGKQNGFDFKQVVGTLIQLSDRSEVHVRELSLQSGAIKLEATPETDLRHPRDYLAEHLVSVL